jgi:LytS/YehU family sensor histidine kinase
VRCENDRLHIIVGNSRPRLAAVLARSDYGYGLGNVDARIRAAYGEAATLSVGPGADEGTQAELNLPVHVRPVDACIASQLPAAKPAAARALQETIA